MISIAISKGLPKFIAAGVSMGSATSLYSAKSSPELVSGVIMVKPPKAWNRNPAQKYKSAEQCRVRHPSEQNYLCLIGTALSDFPPKDSPLYSIIKCPVLILQVEGDENHPVSTAYELK
jgi:pimeloyl-ACP methyl ester carboxylesterase